jgi:hypothetical protein
LNVGGPSPHSGIFNGSLLRFYFYVDSQGEFQNYCLKMQIVLYLDI